MLGSIATDAEKYTRPSRLSRKNQLWLLAVLLFGVGDLATTIYFLSQGMNFEGNPIAVMVLQHGYTYLVAWKVVVFAMFYVLYRGVPRNFQSGVPFGLALIGFLITVWNIYSSLTGARIYF
jgi:hypothetical protein